MRRVNKKSILAWFLVFLVVVFSFVQVILDRQADANNTPGRWLLALVNGILPGLFLAGVGALIISKQNRNRVGWLLILAALGGSGPSKDVFLSGFSDPPAVLTPGLWLLLWFDNWSWMIFIFPLFLIPLNFPDGKPPGLRWQWVNRLAAGMVIFLV